MCLCNHLLLFFLVLAHTTCIAAVHWDELSASSSDLDAFFPPKRVADAKSIPCALLAAGVLLLTCVYSHASWTSGVAGQIEPLVLYLKNMGLSGINKTGCFNYVNYLFHKIRDALVSLASDAAACVEKRLRINRKNIPESDHTGTQAALIKKHSESRSMMANHDEKPSSARPRMVQAVEARGVAFSII